MYFPVNTPNIYFVEHLRTTASDLWRAQQINNLPKAQLIVSIIAKNLFFFTPWPSNNKTKIVCPEVFDVGFEQALKDPL